MTECFSLIVSCEHGGNRIPAAYRHLFVTATARQALDSHRGWDPGALDLAKQFSRTFQSPCFVSETSRLLVDLNRSRHHRNLFSEYSRRVTKEQRRDIIARYYLPFRAEVLQGVQAQIADNHRILHLSVHSFTPVLNGQVRNAGIGVLYDPARNAESELAKIWCTLLHQRRPELNIRRNYPYRGAADGHVTALRKQFPEQQYLGFELEVNQKWIGAAGWNRLRRDLIETFQCALPNGV